MLARKCVVGPVLGEPSQFFANAEIIGVGLYGGGRSLNVVGECAIDGGKRGLGLIVSFGSDFLDSCLVTRSVEMLRELIRFFSDFKFKLFKSTS